MAAAIGKRAPHFTLDQLDGSPVALGDLLDGQHHLMLVFLRHLA